MNVMIVDDDSASREILEGIVQSMGHRTRAHASTRAALDDVLEWAPDVIITNWMMPDMNGLELCRRIREMKLKRYMYLILATGSEDEHTLKQIFDNEIDDFVRRPYYKGEVISRVRAGSRIAHLEEKLRERIMDLESAYRRLELSALMGGASRHGGESAEAALRREARPEGRRDLEALRRTDTWQNIEHTMTLTFSQALMARLERGTVPQGDIKGETFIATIMMSDVANELEIGLGVVATRPSAERISRNLFGDGAGADRETVQDLLRELMNMLQGALKISFEHDGFDFVASIPEDRSLKGFVNWCHQMGGVRSVAFTGDGIELFAVLVCREKENTAVTVGELHEGMIVAQAIKDPDGQTLVACGTRINSRNLGELQKLDAAALVEVCRPGAD